MAEHSQGLIEGFSKKHGVKMLVWHDRLENMEAAIKREISQLLDSRAIPNENPRIVARKMPITASTKVFCKPTQNTVP